MKSFLTTIAAVSLSLNSLWAIDQNHSQLTQLVTSYAKPSGVDYSGLKKKHGDLKAYLKELAAVEYSEFKKWSQNEQLAFLINLYNGATLDLVLKHYPIKSLKDDVGGSKGPWKIPAVQMFGKTTSLDTLEHEFIRKYYNEPRIHFALNCASEGCPPLRKEAYTGAKLPKQLQEQTVAFLANTKVNQFSQDKLVLSPLFDWFKDDFVKKSGSVEAFLDPYFPKIKIAPGQRKISYSDYGWALNDAR